MRCRDAKVRLTAQRDKDLAQPGDSTVQEHLKQGATCRIYEEGPDTQLRTSSSRMYSSISTERIMRAVEQQRRISQQLEDLRAQQKTRIAHMRIFTPRFAALAYLSMGLLSLTLLALFIFQTDLVVKVLALLSGGIDIVVTLTQYLQTGLAFITHDTWLLSGMALVLVVMTGMWLRLMHPPQEV